MLERIRIVTAVVCLAVVPACLGPVDPPDLPQEDGGLAPDACCGFDAGPFDGGPDDAGPFDAGPFDGGPPDACCAYDAGPFDGGPYDAGPFDGGPFGGCRTDWDCERGSVCEPLAIGTMGCVPGCHNPDQCPPGDLCQRVACFAAPCPGQCVSPVECQDDLGCANLPGTVCEPKGPGCLMPGTCVPGCHARAVPDQCPPDETCQPRMCLTCPCPGMCVPTQPVTCRDDLGCANVPGTVCELGTGCQEPATCVPGCRENWQCHPGQTCIQPACLTCPCPGICVDRPPPACQRDLECPAGSVCELGTACQDPSRCVPGCHDSLQCRPGQRCNQLMCLTCPCPGMCVDDPCVDADGDGYVETCTKIFCGPNLSNCDCDDHDPKVNLGAVEICGNGKDDNCDGNVDEGCSSTCLGGASECATDLDCAWGRTKCDLGCCVPCPELVGPGCLPDQCFLPGGVDMRGCPAFPVCGACCACPAYFAPVCSVRYATYGNPCEADCARDPILHDGACLTGEGLGCGFDTNAAPCAPGQYCRDTCPMCGRPFTELRCTRIGACVTALDCPAGLTPPACNRGPGTWSCADNTCLFSCP